MFELYAHSKEETPLLRTPQHAVRVLCTVLLRAAMNLNLLVLAVCILEFEVQLVLLLTSVYCQAA